MTTQKKKITTTTISVIAALVAGFFLLVAAYWLGKSSNNQNQSVLANTKATASTASAPEIGASNPAPSVAAGTANTQTEASAAQIASSAGLVALGDRNSVPTVAQPVVQVGPASDPVDMDPKLAFNPRQEPIWDPMVDGVNQYIDAINMQRTSLKNGVGTVRVLVDSEGAGIEDAAGLTQLPASGVTQAGAKQVISYVEVTCSEGVQQLRVLGSIANKDTAILLHAGPSPTFRYAYTNDVQPKGGLAATIQRWGSTICMQYGWKKDTLK